MEEQYRSFKDIQSILRYGRHVLSRMALYSSSESILSVVEGLRAIEEERDKIFVDTILNSEPRFFTISISEREENEDDLQAGICDHVHT